MLKVGTGRNKAMTFHIDIHTDDSILAAIFWYGSVVGLSGWVLYTLYTECCRACTSQIPNSPVLGAESGLHEIKQVTDHSEI